MKQLISLRNLMPAVCLLAFAIGAAAAGTPGLGGDIWRGAQHRCCFICNAAETRIFC